MKLLIMLTGTFGISSATAGAIYVALNTALKSGALSVGRVVLLMAGTGVGALLIISIFAVGGTFIMKKLKAGRAATVAW
ncbi:hypothetical protein HF326_15380 [Bacillus altitudinis MN12]|uniref:Circular bacteriocin, circularin A/uberolysin family n=2 Tax=Bacillus TaxID=1386 RepID=A0AAU7FML7_9BACI|nr:hypothetical protein [Bacillus altitudinis]MCA1016265.1 hypothetical protein [Bacillus stratosphericus]KLV22157.1 hypothetical protein ABW03_11410 [Bacillus altitudinis]MBR0584427.1 hypothetical protein [Bacillus altitudinis MN12]MBR0596067.1 hypothetical protein [Bacillus altitudinis C16B11]MBR0610752.1 hypothetical protein [Bacillus altitudinis]